jgi:hypothetical protein
MAGGNLGLGWLICGMRSLTVVTSEMRISYTANRSRSTPKSSFEGFGAINSATVKPSWNIGPRAAKGPNSDGGFLEYLDLTLQSGTQEGR